MRYLIAVAVLLAPVEAAAQTYVVQQGDCLGEIAERHGMPLSELIRINGIEDPDLIAPGQELTLTGAEGEVVERGVIHVLHKGVTLGHVAAAYGVPRRVLVKANKIRNPDLVREGARILVPGATRVVPIATKVVPPCLHDPVEIYRVRTRETRHIVLTRCNGSIWEEGVDELSTFLDRTGADDPPLLNSRLIQQLQKVADHFAGRRIEVVSAYRAPVGEQRASSRHCKAMAMDFRVQGVPNVRLRDYARTLGDVGVGFYPNSTFVHLDVRERPAFWVDWSGPGETPRYGSVDVDPAERRELDETETETEPEAAAPGRLSRGGAIPSPGTSAAP